MHTSRRHSLGRLIRRHFLLITIVFLLCAASLAAIQWFTASINAVTDERKAESAAELARLDAEIQEIVERKAEEERLRKLEEAKQTAEEVIRNPSQAAQTIDASSCNVSGKRTDASQPSVLVNKKHCVQPLSYTPSDLVTVNGATISAKAADDFQALFLAAQAAGQTVSVTSSYRSYSTQTATYNYWVSISGAAGADEYSARPGYSEHQTGFAVDFANSDGSCSLNCFGTTSQYAWLQDNAATYGFIQRYYAGKENVTGYMAEEWHYRYVGPPVALDMKTKDILTLEEYWGLPGGGY